MQNINWQQFGLKKNPYDTIPLVEGGDLPIQKAFVGREREKGFLDNLFESENRSCLTICGNVGVGKTSLANFQKVVWKYNKSKLLFSFRREMEACDELLNKKNFLIEIIGSVLREIKLLQPELFKNELLIKLNQVVDINQTISISAGVSAYGFGIDAGKEKALSQPIQFPIATLEEYFISLVEFIKNNEISGHKYSGLIVHVNNFDVVLMDSKKKKNVISFFNDVRDILQTPDVHFIFIGPNNFFKDIISSQRRVKSIFSQIPLKLNPLGKSEIVLAFEERMKILKSNDVAYYIKPVEDEVIFRLYDIYQGDIRLIMTAIKGILNQCSNKAAKSLSTSEAILLLGKELWHNIEMAMASELTEERKRVLYYLIEKGKISKKDVALKFKKDSSNVSGYYFKPLKEADIIEEIEKEGNIKHWGLTQKYIPLKWLSESQKNVQQNIKLKQQALPLSF